MWRAKLASFLFGFTAPLILAYLPVPNLDSSEGIHYIIAGLLVLLAIVLIVRGIYVVYQATNQTTKEE